MSKIAPSAMTPKTAGALDGQKALSERLRDRTTLRFMGNCKCGNCQLVPRPLLDEAIVATASNADLLEALKWATKQIGILSHYIETPEAQAKFDACEAAIAKATATDGKAPAPEASAERSVANPISTTPNKAGA